MTRRPVPYLLVLLALAAFGGLARAATWPTEADTVAAVRAVYAELAAAHP